MFVEVKKLLILDFCLVFFQSKSMDLELKERIADNNYIQESLILKLPTEIFYKILYFLLEDGQDPKSLGQIIAKIELVSKSFKNFIVTSEKNSAAKQLIINLMINFYNHLAHLCKEWNFNELPDFVPYKEFADKPLKQVYLELCLNFNINKRNLEGNTPLLAAANWTFTGVIRELLRVKDIDINAQTATGYTALMISISKNDFQSVQALLKMNTISFNLKTKDNKTVFDLAKANGNKKIIEALKKYDPNPEEDCFWLARLKYLLTFIY